jgi:hypothetical protein
MKKLIWLAVMGTALLVGGVTAWPPFETEDTERARYFLSHSQVVVRSLEERYPTPLGAWPEPTRAPYLYARTMYQQVRGRHPELHLEFPEQP